MRDRIAEIIAQYHYAYEAWDASDGFPAMPRTIDYADQIISALTLPTVWLECGECGGKGIMAGEPKLVYSDRADGPVTHEHSALCTCKSGKREYQIMWRTPCESEWNPNITDIDKPLSYLDLGDHHVAHAYWAVIELREAHMIGNNKGKLVLREVE